ncbi:MAG: sugar ABC transporter substrate-binding protein [Lachnospiraceae bacterium]|nr:sugar ABC transporter substrate-binding protein [Lachnospiraceae bacterium]
MHSIESRIAAILAVLLIAGVIIGVAASGKEITYPVEEEVKETATYEIGKDTLRIWYTDENLTDYLNKVAVNYASEHEGIRVVPVLVSGREYLEGISDASMSDEELPDLFITTGNTLEKANLAGLADPIEPPEGVDIVSMFPQTAINAITYKDSMVAYPMFFECSALCYNYTYLEDWARNTLESEIRAEMAEQEKEAAENKTEETKTTDSKTSDSKTTDSKTSDSKTTDSKTTTSEEDKKKAEEEAKKAQDELISSMVSDEDVAAYIDENLPVTIDKLLVLSNNFDAPEGVDTIFKWAVTDIFYNYFFIGDSIKVGGAHGDDTSQIDIYNEDAIKGLTTYQNLNQFFSISTDDVSYSGVLEDFKEGRIVMTIVTSDSVRMLKEASDEGELDFEYRFAPLPNISEAVPARSMSVTDAIAINGYSDHKEQANDFAYYLCSQDPKDLYEWTGKVSSLSKSYFDGYNDPELSVFASEYTRSIPLPKMLETSNYWVNLELIFASVWDGADANECLKELSEQMKLQVTGEEVTEEKIVIEEEVVEEDEIIEEDTIPSE